VYWAGLADVCYSHVHACGCVHTQTLRTELLSEAHFPRLIAHFEGALREVCAAPTRAQGACMRLPSSLLVGSTILLLARWPVRFQAVVLFKTEATSPPLHPMLAPTTAALAWVRGLRERVAQPLVGRAGAVGQRHAESEVGEGEGGGWEMGSEWRRAGAVPTGTARGG